METTTTKIEKGKGGWRATTILSFDEAAKRKLHLATYKQSSGLVTFASVHEHPGDGSVRHRFALGSKGQGDFSQRVTVSKERCTEEAVTRQHASALRQAPTIIEQARAHYASQDSKQATDELLGAIQKCRRFISAEQIHVMTENCRGEEGEWFRAKILELAKLFDTMPATYQSESSGEDAIVHLHYFHGSGDWYITEKDSDEDHAGQVQAFGLADPFGDGGEMGYISILELIRANVDFDLHWKPTTLKALREKRETRATA